MPETDKTKLVAANTSNSLRCTVPASIVRMLKLAEGDHFEWKISAVKSEFKVELIPIRSRVK